MLISVVMPLLNAEKYLRQALDSVLCQTYKNFEIVIVDGDSSDTTLDIIRQYQDPRIKWISEKDHGTTDAMNKGIRLAWGQIITFLNADDYFLSPDLFAKIVTKFNHDKSIDLVYGDLQLIRSADETFERCLQADPSQMPWGMSIFMPGSFIRRELLDARNFDKSLDFANDYDLFSYFLQVYGARMDTTAQAHVCFRTQGRSNERKNSLRVARETFVVRSRYYGHLHAVIVAIWEFPVAVLRQFHVRPIYWCRSAIEFFRSPKTLAINQRRS